MASWSTRDSIHFQRAVRDCTEKTAGGGCGFEQTYSRTSVMKRKLLLTLWLLAPVLVLAYHYGPGQSALARDKAAALARQAAAFEKADDWASAFETYKSALAALPPEDKASQFKLRLAAANARMYVGELPEAMQDMDNLL